MIGPRCARAVEAFFCFLLCLVSALRLFPPTTHPLLALGLWRLRRAQLRDAPLRTGVFVDNVIEIPSYLPSDTFTTRFGRELSGTYRYDFDTNSCKIAGQEPIQGTTGNTRDTPPR